MIDVLGIIDGMSPKSDEVAHAPALVFCYGAGESSEFAKNRERGRITPNKYEDLSKRLEMYMGGVARIWLKDEFRIEHTGPGINLHWKNSGDILEVSLSNGAYTKEVAHWLNLAAEAAESSIENPMKLAASEEKFGRALCLLAEHAGIDGCYMFKNAATIQGANRVKRFVALFFDSKITTGYNLYFETEDEGQPKTT